MTETYKVLALRYAMRDAKRQDHFATEVPNPDGPMPMDYFVWVLRNGQRTVVVDTGFHAAMADKRNRQYLRSPSRPRLADFARSDPHGE